ncbi:MAG: DMT family transporter [Desulfobacteraceae bacterium]|nr:DMT family transporter [Desulfobacteraceae bacterium]
MALRTREEPTFNPAVAGPLFMLSTALLFTLMNVLVKLLPPDYTVWHITFIRCAGGMIVMVPMLLPKGNPFKGDRIPLLMIRGCTGSIAYFAWIMAMRQLPLSTAIVIFYAFPAFAAIFAFLIYKERIGLFEAGCIGLVIIGVSVLFDFHLAGGLAGQCLAVVAGAFAGITVTLVRSLRQNNGPVVIYLYFCLMGGLATTPKFIMDPIVPSSVAEWAICIGIVLSSVIGQIMMNQGFFYCKGFEGAVFMSSEVVFAAVIGILFFCDPVSWRFWAGSILIMGSVAALNYFKSNNAPPDDEI